MIKLVCLIVCFFILLTPTIQSISSWIGTASIATKRNWSKGQCGKFEVSHLNSEKIAKSFLLSFKICGDKYYGETLIGNHFKYSEDPSIYHIVQNYQGTTYKSTEQISIGEFCLNYKEGFEPLNDLMVSVEFYDDYLLCDNDCEPTCGNGLCQSETENELNCPVDCKAC